MELLHCGVGLSSLSLCLVFTTIAGISIVPQLHAVTRYCGFICLIERLPQFNNLLRQARGYGPILFPISMGCKKVVLRNLT